MELLAPAGSRESLERAQAAGADAVYLGFSAFSARAGAGNFDEAQLRDALAFAHLHRMRVYVTVNTLVKDGELPEVRKLLALLQQMGADGVLVQDLGILRMARREFPALRIHASTQMAIHNRTGVRWCAGMGMKRVVLARECSLAEIRQCVAEGTEIEVFGHGAQCVAVSGECLFSSMVGERSGNRGRCAQPCRKQYRLDGKTGAWLSPRDVCLRDELPALAEAGVASLKMEGRLKRPEYVYTVTESYRRGLDSLAAGAFAPADGAEKEGLKQIFHRGGFMTGYAFGTEDAGVIAPEEVNHQGLRLGRVLECRGNLMRVLLEKDLHDGDGLRLKEGKQEAELTYSGPETRAGEVAVIRLREGLRARAGAEVRRLTDARQLEAARTAPLRKISVRMILEAWPGKPLRLRVTDGKTEAEATGEPVEAARSRETGAAEMEKQIRKTGGTDFEAEEVTVRTGGAFVPVSVLNDVRRAALGQLAEARRQRFSREIPDDAAPGAPAPVPRQPGPEHIPEIWFTVRTAEQAEACRQGTEPLIWYPEDYRPAGLERLAAEMRPGDWLRLPEVCEEETLLGLRRFAQEHAETLGGVLLGSVGQLGLAWPVPVAAGQGVPVMNRDAARLLAEEGCGIVFASPELTGEELRQLMAPGEGLPRILPQVYGRTQLMLLHHCPARTAMGCTRGHRDCALCDRGDARALRGKALEDERGYRFPLLRVRLPEGCLVRLMNALPTDLGDKRISGPRAAEMTGETGAEAAEAARRLRAGIKAAGESTRGHWARPVL